MLQEAEEVNKPEVEPEGEEVVSETPIPKKKAKTKIGNKKKRKKTRTTNRFPNSEAGYEVLKIISYIMCCMKTYFLIT